MNYSNFIDFSILFLFPTCFYVNEYIGSSTGNASETTNDNQTILEKKRNEDEIARLRGENELLKAILIKNGINYAKERTSFKSNEFS